MKKTIFLLFVLLVSTFMVKGQLAYQSHLAALDTLIDADSHRDTVQVSGSKTNVSFAVRVLKISGTVAGTIKIYGSVDGTYYGTAATDSATIVDGNGVYQFVRNYNPYSHWIVVSTTSGTCHASVRAALMWRKQN